MRRRRGSLTKHFEVNGQVGVTLRRENGPELLLLLRIFEAFAFESLQSFYLGMLSLISITIKAMRNNTMKPFLLTLALISCGELLHHHINAFNIASNLKLASYFLCRNTHPPIEFMKLVYSYYSPRCLAVWQPLWQ